MILGIAPDRDSLMLSRDLVPGMVLQLGPYEGELQMNYHGDYPVGGPVIPLAPPSLTEQQGGGSELDLEV